MIPFKIFLSFYFLSQEAASYNVMPIMNPLTKSARLVDLRPFTTYQIMIKMRRTVNGSVEMITSQSQSFTTTISLEEQLAQNVLRADTKDVIIVIFIMIMWIVVIFLFLHRWGT